ncbi:MAG: endo alpha-1,4 polygalactosaminidase [Sulfurovum sp.]|nr:endo alpha-1,4 polygalactosaminidase [Sulfurovum sp.]
MNKNVCLFVFVLFIQACGGSNTQNNPISNTDNNTSSPLENEDENSTSLSSINNHIIQPMPIYNQAYQESFAADTINEIFSTARNAYVLVDPFGDNVTQHINTMKSHNNEVGGYISAGTGENYRDDFAAMQPYLTPTAWPEWPDEFFVSETTTGILPIMKARIDKMASWGLDWVEFDNMDWLDDETRVTYNLTATVTQAQNYINALCDYTHSKGMKCMAKNTVENFTQFDGVLYESYDDDKNWWNHAGLQSFLAAGKPVIINHYNESDCDGVYAWYKSVYHSDKISFICEDVGTQKYKHYNEE